MILLLFTLLLLLVLQLIFVLWNIRQMPELNLPLDATLSRESLTEINHGHPTISILVPVRDEAAHILACLQSILQHPSPYLEVIVLDDNSTDETAQLVAQLADEEPRLRLLQGGEKPAGWMGKSYACQQLADAANGQWLLFLDADVRLKTGALEALWQVAQSQQNGMISGFPYQETQSWLEKLVVPMMMFTIACHLPIRLISRSANPKFAVAHGGFMCIHRQTYLQIGGHGSFRESLLDDMQMAIAVKRAGFLLHLMNVTPFVEMRMYQNAGEVWNGYKKNIYAGVGRKPIILFTVLSFYLALYLLPVVFFFGGMFVAASWIMPAFICYLLGCAIKFQIDLHQKQPLWLCLFLPISIGFVIAIGMHSWWAGQFGQGYIWKGRRYQ